jgi:hypothetical protein
MNLDSPKIIDDLTEIMCGLLQRGVDEQFTNLLAGDMPKAVHELEARLKTKIETIKAGEDFLGLTVIHAPPASSPSTGTFFRTRQPKQNRPAACRCSATVSRPDRDRPKYE